MKICSQSPKGVSYNSYVLLDEKTVLFDTADESISRQYIENVVHALNGRPLDYMVVSIWSRITVR